MRSIKHMQKGNRHEQGSSFIEVGIASAFMAIIVFVGIDCYVWMQAFMLNDIACRDACRAAAQASGTTAATTKSAAQLAAQRQCQIHSVSRPYIGNPTFVAGGFVWQDFGSSGGGALPAPPQTPYVRVQTSMNVNLPIPFRMSGAPLVFQRAYSMPIVNIPGAP